ncbi:hypothetical protein DXG03_002344 [Asterophora parasitica]|uniref:Uncharacterized protein n=1 Tax=Asterophora parasitica TaxID=117018 RepID=A0A9P7K8R0_9AGAR|nr:hypothetical protein DXG03_002344 [Asterophora parasitica]
MADVELHIIVTLYDEKCQSSSLIETHHWALVVLFGRDRGKRMHLIGNPTSWIYESKDIKKFGASRTMRSSIKVGRVRSSHLQWMSDKLREVEVRMNDPTYNCQAWVRDALQLLQRYPDDISIDLAAPENLTRQLQVGLHDWCYPQPGFKEIEEELFPSEDEE